MGLEETPLSIEKVHEYGYVSRRSRFMHLGAPVDGHVHSRTSLCMQYGHGRVRLDKMEENGMRSVIKF